MKTLEWYSLANGLKDFLRNYRYSNGKSLFEDLPNRDALNILVGRGNAGEYPLIEILFGEESRLEKPSNINCAVVQLWIDIYVGGASVACDAQDIGEILYKQIYKMEKELIFAVEEYRKTLYRTYGTAVNIEVQAILSDGDENAPVTVQHRIIIDFTWHLSK